MKRLGPRAYLVLEKKSFKGFYYIRAWKPTTMTILAIFHSPAPRRLNMKFEQYWPRGLRGEVIWNYQHFFSHTNVLGQYKCIRKQKDQTSMYDHHFSNFGWSPVPDDLCKDSAWRRPLFRRRRFFKGFYHIWAWQPSWSMDHDHFSNLSFPCPKEASNEIWATLA